MSVITHSSSSPLQITKKSDDTCLVKIDVIFIVDRYKDANDTPITNAYNNQITPPEMNGNYLFTGSHYLY